MKRNRVLSFDRQAILFMLLLLGLAALAGCTAPTLQSIVTGLTSGQDARGHLVEDVPVIAQGDKLCGPAALASVMNYHGVEVTQKQVADNVFTEKAQGTFTLDMLLYAKDAEGLHATHYSGDLNDIRRRLRDDNPPILFIKIYIKNIRYVKYIQGLIH